MRNFPISTILVFLCLNSASAQSNDLPSYRDLYAKGTKVFNVQLGVAEGDLFNSLTTIEFSREVKNIGVLVLPGYGKFIERNLLLGISGIIGLEDYKEKYQGGTIGNPPVSYTRHQRSKYTDLGLSPFLRYYVPLGKRNTFSLFGQASFPLFYSSYRYSSYSDPLQAGTNYNASDDQVTLKASLGLGVSFNGSFGSFELSANNGGLFLGYQRYLNFGKR